MHLVLVLQTDDEGVKKIPFEGSVNGAQIEADELLEMTDTYASACIQTEQGAEVMFRQAVGSWDRH